MDVPEESVSEGDDKVFLPSRLKTHKTRREKRNLRRQHWEVTRQNSTTGVSVAVLRELQQKDTSLSKVSQSVNSDVACTIDKSFYWHDRLLYCQWMAHK